MKIIQPITTVPITNSYIPLGKQLIQTTRAVDGKITLTVSPERLPHQGGRSPFYKLDTWRLSLDGKYLNHWDRLQLKGIRRTLPKTEDPFLRGEIDMIENTTVLLSNIKKINICDIHTTYVEEKDGINIVSAKLDYLRGFGARSIAMYLGFHLDPLDIYGYFLGALSNRDRTLYQRPHDIGLGVRASLEIYLDPLNIFITNERDFIDLPNSMLDFKDDKISLKNQWV